MLEIWNTVSFTVGVSRKEITKLSWVAHNKKCVLPASLWMDTSQIEAKYSPKSFLLSSVLHKNEVRKLRGNETSSVICNNRVPDEPRSFLVYAFKLFLK